MLTKKVYTIPDHISVTEVEDEIVLLNLDTGSYYGLNHIGTRLIKGIQAKESMHQINSAVADKYQMKYKQVCGDVEELLKQLLEQNLLEQIKK
jgi:hypothetical protein